MTDEQKRRVDALEQALRNARKLLMKAEAAYPEDIFQIDDALAQQEPDQPADAGEPKATGMMLRDRLRRGDIGREQAAAGEPFQARVWPWLVHCFGEQIARDGRERNHRFLEEALELVQSTGCAASEAHQLVDYVFGRSVGEPHQETGGVMVTLAALCLAHGLDMHTAGEDELTRVWDKADRIMAKQAAKPAHGPLPGPSEPAAAGEPSCCARTREECAWIVEKEANDHDHLSDGDLPDDEAKLHRHLAAFGYELAAAILRNGGEDV